ncbi:MAG: hypothetical protein CMO31_00210 [Trueperaceae bacterium]|nr:hypothetical protein [Trueperaceae bacterium]
MIEGEDTLTNLTRIDPNSPAGETPDLIETIEILMVS